MYIKDEEYIKDAYCEVNHPLMHIIATCGAGVWDELLIFAMFASILLLERLTIVNTHDPELPE